jgi:uncharacterized protein YndB with AHSA1/START domain
VTSRALVALRIAAPPNRVFTAFTAETGQWWRPHGLFELKGRRDGRLAITAGVGGRITESYPDGEEFEVGHVRVWDPPARLVFSWRAASFPTDRETEVHVRFEDVDGGTRVVWSSTSAGTASRMRTSLATASRCSRSSNAWPSGGGICSTRWPTAPGVEAAPPGGRARGIPWPGFSSGLDSPLRTVHQPGGGR